MRWRQPLVCLLLTFLIASGLRLLEVPFWDNLAYRLGGEHLLATHDAYHWIAGAEGFGRAVGHPMALMARFFGWLAGVSPAEAGFWAPSFLSGLMAVSVFLWGWGMGRPLSGLCAGVLASLTPAFCARTLLGFYDTDIVIVTFAVLVGLVPALWISPWLAGLPEVVIDCLARRKKAKKKTGSGAPDNKAQKDLEPLSALPAGADSVWFFGKKADRAGLFLFGRAEMERSMLTWPWLLLLVASGLFGHSMQSWHSLFPYLVRFSALTPLLVIPFAGPRGGRMTLLAGALCHSFPLLLGWPGAGLGLAYAWLLMFTRRGHDEPEAPASPDLENPRPQKPAPLCWRLSPLSPDFRRALVRSRVSVMFLWALILFCALDADVFEAMRRSFAAYVMRDGDAYPMSGASADPVIFPSVTLSIIEVQPISIQALFSYIYPLEALTLIALGLFIARLLFTPVFIWLLPLLAICFLSPKMGARMTLFGPPVVMLALCLEGGLLLEQLYRSLSALAGRKGRKLSISQAASAQELVPQAPGFLTRLALCLFCTAVLANPLVRLMPDYTQGSIISREQAEALSHLKSYSPRDSMIWNWWDWGYAAHHFAQRNTIADGALHGGAALFLPAAVYATQDARSARQIIKYAATRGDAASDVFAGLSASQAQRLMEELADPNKALIKAPGKQYLVVSFELLRLGVWVTRYGSWNFETKQYAGSLMNNLSAGLTFNLDTGVILPQGEKTEPIYAASINLLERRKLERTVYNRYGAYHFLFSTQYNEQETKNGRLSALARDFWRAVRPDYVFPAAVSDKIVMDEDFFNSMMVQLLISPQDDPAIAPYFKLIFDNRYARVYEVL